MPIQSEHPVGEADSGFQIDLPPRAPGDAEVDIEVLQVVPKQFAVVDEQTANWVIKRIIAARQYAERVEAWGQQELHRAAREEQTLMFLFGRQLQEWVRGEIEKLRGKKKSVNLPAGVVGFRTISPCLQVDDESAVIVWARDNCPTAVTTVEKLSRTELKAYCGETGVLPDEGAHIEPGGEKFYIK